MLLKERERWEGEGIEGGKTRRGEREGGKGRREGREGGKRRMTDRECNRVTEARK